MDPEGPVILAIDDEEDILTSLKAVITYAFPNAGVLTALNGERGIWLALAENPDVIILDITMPGMDGYEVCREIKKEGRLKDIPVIFLTGLKGSMENRVKALEAGAEAFLSKPFDVTELIVQIRAMVKIREANKLKQLEKERLAGPAAGYTRELSGKIAEHRKAQEELLQSYQKLDNTRIAMLSLLEDLKEEIESRKEMEEALKKSEEKYRSIFENAVEGIFQTAPEGRFITVNPSMAHMHGFASPEEMIAGIIDIGTQLYVNPEDRERYRAILEKKGEVNNFEAQVYRKDGNAIWSSTNARSIRDAAGNVSCFEGTTEDITSRKLAEEELKLTLDKLRKSLSGTIQAMSLTVETRDPYTAGHQRRVSSLARSIAQEMGLSNDTVDTIRMAGIIHDIGKISVPAEILSKPTKLTDIEFSLIQVHSQTAYDILKDVGLPYPIAEIVLQHHERLDGSGYPQGLKNGQILLEARIISVADVIEAIASHRPYRPGFGIDVALEEIEKNKGVFYDAGVVEACLKLFREKRFTFEPVES